MVSILAHLARFMLVDLTDASSTSDVVATIIPQTFVPVQPLIKSQPLMIDGKAAATHDTTYLRDPLPQVPRTVNSENFDRMQLTIMCQSQVKLNNLTHVIIKDEFSSQNFGLNPKAVTNFVSERECIR